MSQNTGNPVLDSLVNIVADRSAVPTSKYIRDIHAVLLECAEKEPGGLERSREMMLAIPKPTSVTPPQGKPSRV